MTRSRSCVCARLVRSRCQPSVDARSALPGRKGESCYRGANAAHKAEDRSYLRPGGTEQRYRGHRHRHPSQRPQTAAHLAAFDGPPSKGRHSRTLSASLTSSIGLPRHASRSFAIMSEDHRLGPPHLTTDRLACQHLDERVLATRPLMLAPREQGSVRKSRPVTSSHKECLAL